MEKVGTSIGTIRNLYAVLRKTPMIGIGLGAATIVLLLIHLSLIEFAYDDAYIHFRIAGNLAEHGEPYYNLGEAVKGSSSTLWTIVLASIFRVTGVALWPVAVLNSFLLIANGIVYGVLTMTAFPNRRLLPWATGSLVVAGLLPTSVGLMETGLAVLLIGVAWILLQQKIPAGFAVGAVAVFARPEVAIFMVVAVFAAIATSAFRFRVIGIWGVAATLPLLIFDLLFYGSPIPHAAIAKSIVFPLTTFEALSLSGSSLAAGLVGQYRALGAGLFLLLGLLSITVLWRAQPPPSGNWTKWLLISFSTAGMTVLLAYVLAGTFVFPWYAPLFTIPVLLGGVWMVATDGRVLTVLAAAALWTPTLILASATLLAAVDHSRLDQPLYANARVGQLLAVAEVLRDECSTCRLLAPEIGALGYQFGGYVVDSVGLVTPAALKYHPMAVPEERANRFLGAAPAGLVAETRPGFIVGLSGFVRSVLESPQAADYRVLSCPVTPPGGYAGLVASQFFGMTELFVMVRKDLDPLGSAVLDGTRATGCASWQRASE